VPLVCLVLGLSIAAFGLLAIGLPELFASILHEAQTPAGLYIGAGSRVVLGISLLLSGPHSRVPEILWVFGIVFLAAGLIMPFLGLAVFRWSLDAFLSLGPWAARVWGVVALALGLFLAWAVAPRSRAAQQLVERDTD
jgi:hypothetical protein